MVDAAESRRDSLLSRIRELEAEGGGFEVDAAAAQRRNEAEHLKAEAAEAASALEEVRLRSRVTSFHRTIRAAAFEADAREEQRLTEEVRRLESALVEAQLAFAERRAIVAPCALPALREALNEVLAIHERRSEELSRLRDEVALQREDLGKLADQRRRLSSSRPIARRRRGSSVESPVRGSGGESENVKLRADVQRSQLGLATIEAEVAELRGAEPEDDGDLGRLRRIHFGMRSLRDIAE
jgi:hypothetical protein